MHKITIPTPCHQNWDEMLPNNQGRHCLSCAKTVVDFTSMNNDEVQNYFINKQHQLVCGRFKATQLKTIDIKLPQNIFNLTMPLWKQVLVACLLAFGMMLFSCNAHTTGETIETKLTGAIIIKQPDSTQKQIDTFALPKPPKNIEEMKGVVKVVETYIVGDIAPPTPIEPQQEVLIGKPLMEEDPKIDSVKVNDTARCNKNIFL
jgi:hypothetical protein